MKELTIKEFASMGGKASVKSRFDGKSKAEISQIMKSVRLSKKQKAEVDSMVDTMVESLRQIKA
jgi:hypothetical protein